MKTRKIILIDGADIRSVDDIHDIFFGKLSFPEYYGKNLDALFDMLTETNKKIGIILVNTEKIREEIGKRKYNALVRMLTDAVKENENIKLSIDPIDGE